MEFAEALKKVKAERKASKENYMVFKFGYDSKIVVPHKDGVTILAALVNAEQLDEPYNAQHRITSLERSKLEIQTLSDEEYENFKVAALLNMSIADLKRHKEDNHV